jgi:glycogen debranching enzyme
MLFDYSKKERIKRKVISEIRQLKDKKGFLKAGLPSYGRLFGRDSLISAWQLLDFNPEISKKTLEILSKFQGKKENKEREEEPGKILHEMDFRKKFHPRHHFPFPYYGSVDSTPLYLILFSFYFKKTEDINFLKKYWQNILLALNWIFNFGDGDGDLFLEYKRKNPRGLFHQGWRDGFEDHLKIIPPVAIVEVQGYQYLALNEMANLSKILGDEKLANSLFVRAEKLKEKFNKKFWMPNKKYFSLALDGKKRQKKSITSSPGHLLFTGICEKEKAALVVKRLFQKDLWTSYGIRNHSSLEPDFNPKSYHLGSIWPHDNWVIAQGLKNLGYKKEYKKIKKAILLAYQKIGFLPEFYGVVDGKITLDLEREPCHPQAWASGALLNFLQNF